MQKCIKTLVLLFFVSYSVKAQTSPLKAFCRLELPEKIWIIKHPCVAKRSYRITQQALEQTELVKNKLLLNNDAAGGQLDAFRHGYWMAALTKNIGYKKAISLGKAHEKANYRSFLRSKKEDNVFADAALSEMDLFNNVIGAGIARLCISDCNNDTLAVRIVQNIRQGYFKIIKKDRNGNCLNYNNEVIDCDNKKRSWASEKVLVASDQLAK